MEDVKEVEQKELTVQEDNVCEIFCDVCEITCGVIPEQEWKEAVKEDVELSGVCEALENGRFGALGGGSAGSLTGGAYEKDLTDTSGSSLSLLLYPSTALAFITEYRDG
ncbi:hypothetical protein NDU88_002667 [Pleurodeles waltl]|uniref:Uncharacterized protein n=1 Tax=Pleurodeles waltl TaxID=8319 RepID=A0AAV7QDL0_PLEWA|nr:hypothetical protein NDU88_002667 [Pleurodeles waltl]